MKGIENINSEEDRRIFYRQNDSQPIQVRFANDTIWLTQKLILFHGYAVNRRIDRGENQVNLLSNQVQRCICRDVAHHVSTTIYYS